jgi:hypothetical protein
VRLPPSAIEACTRVAGLVAALVLSTTTVAFAQSQSAQPGIEQELRPFGLGALAFTSFAMDCGSHKGFCTQPLFALGIQLDGELAISRKLALGLVVAGAAMSAPLGEDDRDPFERSHSRRLGRLAVRGRYGLALPLWLGLELGVAAARDSISAGAGGAATSREAVHQVAPTLGLLLGTRFAVTSTFALGFELALSASNFGDEPPSASRLQLSSGQLAAGTSYGRRVFLSLGLGGRFEP